MPAPKIVNRSSLFTFVIVLEAILLVVATIWCRVADIDLRPHLHGRAGDILLGAALGIGLAGSSLLMYWLGKFKPFRWLEGSRDLVTQVMGPLFAGATLFDIVIIAAASGFCEEVLFRGAMQAEFGLIPASLIFGILHTAGARYPHYPIWAFAAGLMFGGLYQATGSLWPPIVAHFVNNLLGLYALRAMGKRLPAQDA